MKAAYLMMVLPVLQFCSGQAQSAANKAVVSNHTGTAALPSSVVAISHATNSAATSPANSATPIATNIGNSELAGMAAGTVKANCTGANASPQDCTASTWFDQAFCNTVGYMVVRLSGAWSCSRAVPMNVTWWGVVGDNSTDNSAALAQVYAAAVGAGGGVLYFPPGNFRFSQFPTISNGGIYIKGSGVDATSLITTSPSNSDITFASTSHVGISDMTLTSSAPKSGGASIYVYDTSTSFIENIRILSPFNGIYVDNLGHQTATKINNLMIEGVCQNVGVALGVNTGASPQVNEVFLTNATIVGCLNANVYIASADGIYLSQVSTYQGGHGLTFNPPTGSLASHVLITNSVFDSATGPGVLINSGGGFTGSISILNTMMNSNYQGLHVEAGSNLHGLAITNSYFEHNAYHGVVMLSGQDVSMSNNFICDNAYTGSGNAPGVYYNGTGLIFMGNTSGQCGVLALTNQQSYGLQLGPFVDKALVINNRFPSNLSGGLSSSTGNPNVVISPNYNW